MLGPEAQTCLPGEVGVVRDDVHLGVVEERMLVEIRGTERQPVVVDDCDLGVDVDRVSKISGAGEEGAGQQSARVALRLLVGFDQPRVARHVGGEDRGKTAHDCGDFGHGFPFAHEYSRAHQLSHGSARSTRPDPARGAS